MAADAPTELSFGESLLPDDGDPAPLPDDLPDGAGLVEAARATPFLTRLGLLLPYLREPGGLPVDTACVRIDAYVRNQGDDVLGDRAGYAATVLGLALDAGLVELDTRPGQQRLVAGPQAELVAEHPLAAWGEALTPMLLCDPIPPAQTAPRWHDEGMASVLPLLLQRLVLTVAPVDLEAVADGLCAEIADAADGRPRPRRRRVVRQLRLLLTLLREFGLATWEPPSRTPLGGAQVTPLGLFGWVVFTTSIHGPGEELARQLAEAGYLEADGGYVDAAALPIPPVWN